MAPVNNSKIRYKEGTIHNSYNSGRYKIIKYLDRKKIQIKFIATKYTCFAAAHNLDKGQVKDPLVVSVFGKGFLGDGEFTKANKVLYDRWRNILLRCYGDGRNTKYKECRVHKRWLNFQLFCVDAQKLKNWDLPSCHIDKDILVQNNKIYGPGKCCFVPAEINKALQRENKTNKGKLKCVLGVTKSSAHRYHARGKSNSYFNTEEEAYLAYKTARIKYIKNLAIKYKNDLSTKIYQILMEFDLPSYTQQRKILMEIREEIQ